MSGNNVNSRMCPICQHPERAEIERCILSMGPSNPTLTLAVIADAFGVRVDDLRVHTLMHTPLALDFSNEAETALVENFQFRAGKQSPESASTQGQPSDQNQNAVSASTLTSGATLTATAHTTAPAPRMKDRLTDKLNLREGDMLLASATEMLTTLTTLGRRIKTFASDNSDGSDQRLAAFCSTAMVNLYVGTSSELRKNIQAIGDLNARVNGEVDSGTEGLKALAEVLGSSIRCNSTAEKATEDNDEA